jgi:hypothetical protein
MVEEIGTGCDSTVAIDRAVAGRGGAGRPISRIALACEAGRDGFWLARWLIARGIEAHVIHSASVAVSVSASERRRIVWMRRCFCAYS